MVIIKNNISLKPYNSFGVEVQADFFIEVFNEQEISDLISSDVFSTHPHLILGGGANILFTKDYKGLVVKMSLLGKQIVKQSDDVVYIKIGSGENRHEFVLRTLKKGYVGLENLVLIPGQVGAAPVGNIGAYGREAKDIVFEVEGIDIATQEKRIRTNSQCEFAYRESIFKGKLKNKIIITAVTFVLQKRSPDYLPDIEYKDIQESILSQGLDVAKVSAEEVANIIISIREGKLPDQKQFRTAGSFFKNPVVEKDQFEKLLIEYPQLKGNIAPNGIKLSAGQLIELAGYKGKREGAVGTYNNHALIIINYGTASGLEIEAFAQSIQKKVLELFGVTLEPEVIIVHSP